MAKQATANMEKPGIIDRARDFIQEVKVEMAKVTWPSQAELKSSTQVVLLLLVIMASVIYAYDMVFQQVIVGLLRMGAGS